MDKKAGPGGQTLTDRTSEDIVQRLREASISRLTKGEMLVEAAEEIEKVRGERDMWMRKAGGFYSRLKREGLA